MSNFGASPIPSARIRYNPAPARLPLSTTTMRTGADGEITRLNTLSVASASLPARTVTRMFFDGTVNGWNATDADPSGAMLSGKV